MPPQRQYAVTRPTRDCCHLGLGLLAVLLSVLPNLGCCLGAILSLSAWPLQHLSLDLRSLALARVLLGLTLLEDLRQRASDLRSFYTDTGACPRFVALHPGGKEHVPKNPRLHPDDFSVYNCVGSAAGVGVLFAAAAAAALAFTLGWHSRAAAVVCYVHVRSVVARNGVVHQGGDTLLRVTVGWAALLPTGARWSLDSAGWGAGAGDGAVALACLPNAHLSGASVGWLLQLALLYCFTAMFKVDPAWTDGRAVRFTCSNFAFARQPAAGWLLRMPPLVRLLTKATVWVEAAAPLLVLWALPGSCAARTAATVIFVGFHCSLHATMLLGIFPLACVAAWAACFPTCAWDALLGEGQGGQQGGAACAAVSDGGVGVVLSAVVELAFALLLMALACRANLTNLAGVQPFATALATTTGKPQLDGAIAARDARDRAARRCLIGIPAPWTSQPLEARCRQLLFDAVVWCIGSAATASPLEARLARALGQNQQWFLFDKPARKSFLFLVHGTTAAGVTVDLLHPPVPQPPGGDASAVEPARPWAHGPLSWEHAFGNNRWRKWLHRTGEAKYVGYRDAFATFLASRWEAAALAAGVGADAAVVDKVVVSMCAKMNEVWTEEERAAGLRDAEEVEGGTAAGGAEEGKKAPPQELDTENWHLAQLWQWQRTGAVSASESKKKKKK